MLEYKQKRNNGRTPFAGVVQVGVWVCTDIRYLMETEDKTKEKTKGLHRGILKTGVLHKEFCAQSQWENLKCGNKRKNNRSLHRECIFEKYEMMNLENYTV